MRRPASVLRRKKKAPPSSSPVDSEGGTTKQKEEEEEEKPTGRMVRSSASSSSNKVASLKMDDIVRLNVGGQRFDTHLRTLLADRSNELFAHFVVLLEPDLTEAKMPPRDSDGSFFLDRDPEHFRTLLNSLRFAVHMQAKQKVANGTNGAFEGTEEEVRGASAKSVGIFGRLLKN